VLFALWIVSARRLWNDRASWFAELYFWLGFMVLAMVFSGGHSTQGDFVAPSPIWTSIAPFVAPGLCIGGLALVFGMCAWDKRQERKRRPEMPW
jgi:hypothetical protein